MTHDTSIPLHSRDLVTGFKGSYGECAILEPLSFQLRRGEIIAMIGPNGSGKTTLLRTLGGLQPALGGTIEWFGRPAASVQAAALARRRAMLLTHRLPTLQMSVTELIRLAIPRAEAAPADLTNRSMETAGVSGLRDRRLHQLSDGERQLVAFARALAQDTPVLMLDEPAIHLDVRNRLHLFRQLASLAAEGRCILLSTHELNLAVRFAHRLMLFLPGGRLRLERPEVLNAEGALEQAFGDLGPLNL
jgi:iron complex transport system ATP-binding protein